MENNLALETIKEVATIASGNAATALAKLLGHQVTVAVPSVRLLPIEKTSQMIGPSGQVSTTALVRMQGDMNGLLLFSLDPLEAQDVSAKIVDQHTAGGYGGISQDVLKEMVNIISGAALTAVGKFADMQLMPSVPAGTTDMVGAVVDPFIAELGAQFDTVLLLQEVFTIPELALSVRFASLIDPPSTTKLLDKLRQKIEPGHASN